MIPTANRKQSQRPGAKVLGGVFAASLMAATTVSAAISFDEMDASRAFVINNKVYGAKAYKDMAGGIARYAKDADESGIARGMVENQLMTEAALKIIHNHEAHLAQRYRLWREYEALLNTLYPVKAKEALRKECVTVRDIPANMLQMVVGAQNAPGEMVRPGFTPIAKQYARQVTVAEVKCDGVPDRKVSFAQVIDMADEGLALRVWRGEKDAIEGLRDHIIDLRLHETQLIRDGKLTMADVDTLWMFVEDKQTRVDLEQYLGVTYDIHHSPVRIQELRATITDAEIDAWYAEHPNDYQQISTVRGRHITVESQKVADEVVAKIKGGMPFDEAVTQYSRSPDLKTNPKGELPLIDRRDPTLDFRSKIALILPAGQVSPSYRMPDDKTYEIYWIDHRVGETLPKTDESVRQEIQGQIAHQKAGAEYIALRKKVWKEADIHLNKAMFSPSFIKGWGE